MGKVFQQIVNGSSEVLYQTYAETLRDAVQEAIDEGVDLTGAVLTGQFLAGLNARESNLSSAYLNYADVSGSSFSDSTMTGAKLTSANAAYTDWRDANADSVTFDSATLDGAVFINTSLTGATAVDVANGTIVAQDEAVTVFGITDAGN